MTLFPFLRVSSVPKGLSITQTENASQAFSSDFRNSVKPTQAVGWYNDPFGHCPLSALGVSWVTL